MWIENFKAHKKNGEALVLITAYDAWSASLVDPLGFDGILVGDSVAMVSHHLPNTLGATVEMMEFHVASVARGARSTFIIGDMPFMSFRKGLESAMNAAERLMRAGAHAVKVEGLQGHEDVIRHLVGSGIPVMGHLGLTPQFLHALGGYRVQGTDAEKADQLFEDALKLQELGCFSVVLECVPVKLCERITEELRIPVIGIGAGPSADGQILVFHDALGLHSPESHQAKFVRRFSEGHAHLVDGLKKYKDSVLHQEYPNLRESYQ